MNDPILNKIESGWDNSCAVENYKKAAKWLRIFVQYTKAQGGIPEEYQARAHDWIAFLVDRLDNMDEKSLPDVITAIKTARRQLRAKIEYGSGFKATLTDAERERAARIGKPVDLNFQGFKRAVAPPDNADDAILDNYMGIDGTELD
jgi:hypothetical protein